MSEIMVKVFAYAGNFIREEDEGLHGKGALIQMMTADTSVFVKYTAFWRFCMLRYLEMQCETKYQKPSFWETIIRFWKVWRSPSFNPFCRPVVNTCLRILCLLCRQVSEIELCREAANELELAEKKNESLMDYDDTVDENLRHKTLAECVLMNAV